MFFEKIFFPFVWLDIYNKVYLIIYITSVLLFMYVLNQTDGQEILS